jgi:hypothetical protein
MKIIICSNHKYYDDFIKEKNKTINIKNFKERNIKVKTKKCNEFELLITDDNNKIKKLYNYIPSFDELYKYFPIKKETDINYSLYSNDNPDKSLDVGFKDEDTAVKSLEKIKKKPHGYQVKVVLTLYNRAKYHPHQTNDMKKAMKVFKKWLSINVLK